MRFTRFCMGTLRVCFKYLKSNGLWIKLTYLAFLMYSLLFHGVWGHSEAFSASSAGGLMFLSSSRNYVFCFQQPCWCPFGWAPAWRLHANLYKISPHISLKRNCCDLNLGESLCIFTIFRFPDFGLNLLNSFKVYFDFAWHWKPAVGQDNRLSGAALFRPSGLHRHAIKK